MVNNTHKRLQDIDDDELDFESPWDEDLVTRMVKNMFRTAHMIDSQSDLTFKAAANGTPTDDGATSLLTIDTITSGVFERDDQFNTSYIRVTNGAASGQGRESRFPIIDSDESAQTFTVGLNNLSENLNDAGMDNNDTFEVIGHVHDGTEDLGDLSFQTYSETGQSQSVNRVNTSGSTNGNHTLILPVPGVDFLVLIQCATFATYQTVGTTPTAGRGAGIVFVNSVELTKAELDVSGSADRGTDIRNDNGSTIAVIARDGQSVSAQAQITAPDVGTMTSDASFNVLAFQRL